MLNEYLLKKLILHHLYIATQLELAFSTLALRQLCESQLKAERQLGVGVAAALRNRIADFWDAESVSDLVAGPPQVVDESPPGLVEVPLGDGYFVRFRANHASIPKLASGGVDWVNVSRIRILEIGVQHG